MPVRTGGRRLPLLLATVTLLAGATGCGGTERPTPSVSHEAQACRSQWDDVAQTILDMDGDTTPSALSQRWSTIIAGVDYQRHNAGGRHCSEDIEEQVREIGTLRKLGERLRVYDMAYQLRTIQPQVEIYLNEPVPRSATSENGQKVRPPTHRAVQQALDVLTARAEEANAQLQPAWDQAAAIDLSSPDEIRTAITDLDRLAQSSPAFGACEQALQVLVAAVRAEQESE